MTEIKSSIRITAKKEKVWDIIADLGDVVSFHPFVKDSAYISEKREGVGAARFCDFGNMVLNETASAWREGESYTLTIDFVKGQKPPVKNLQGTLTVKEINPRETEITMHMSYQPKGLMGVLMNPIMVRPTYQKMLPVILQGLKHYAETGKKASPSQLKTLNYAAA